METNCYPWIVWSEYSHQSKLCSDDEQWMLSKAKTVVVTLLIPSLVQIIDTLVPISDDTNLNMFPSENDHTT